MNPELKQIRLFFITTVAGIMALSLLATAVSTVLGLAWFPWQVKVQTQMIRASNSYVTTQQAALRQFRLGYDDATTDAQKAGIVRQMREIADTIPGDIQPDIRSFLAGN